MKLVPVFFSLLLVITIASEFQIVPRGKHLHQDCIHRIPSYSFELTKDEISGNTIIVTAEGKSLTFAPCPNPADLTHGPAWKAWTEYNNPSKVTALYGEWKVPPPPTTSEAQILYYWNGVEPEDNSAVLQPVLQYGLTPAGGGNYWGLASWYVSDSDAFVTQLMRVNPGDVVQGDNLILSNGSWVITGGKLGTTQTVSLVYKPPSNDYTWAYQVLEAYSVANCQVDYPTTGTIVFENIAVKVNGQSVVPTWNTQTKNPTCKERAGVMSPTEVSISWN